MPTFNWNLDTNRVSLTPFDQADATYAAARGSAAIRLVCQRGDVNNPRTVFLDAGFQAGIVIRDPANLGAAEAAGPTVLTKGATPADGYIGTTSTDSTFVRDVMRVGVTGNVAELDEYDFKAVFYALPPVGDATESTPFTWTVLPRYYRTGTPPADIVAEWSSPAQLTAAIAQAAAAVKNGDVATFSGLTVSGPTYIQGPIDFPPDQQITQDGGTIARSILTLDENGFLAPYGLSALHALRRNAANNAFEEYLPNTGDGSSLTDLNPGALSGPVDIDKGGTGATSAPAALTALGAAPLDSPTFTGEVTIPVGATIPGFVQSVEGVGPDNTGNVTLPVDQAAGTASLRTLGPDEQQAAPGDDARFPANVTGIRKGAGAGGLDVAAVPGVDVAPFHPVVYTGGNNGTTLAYSGGAAAGGGATNEQNRISDTCGQFFLKFTASIPTGTLVATITFATAYATQLPIIPLLWPVPVFNTTSGNAFTSTGSFYAVLSANTLKIYVGVTLNGTDFGLQYSIPAI